jgi:hypothetical protein
LRKAIEKEDKYLAMGSAGIGTKQVPGGNI